MTNKSGKNLENLVRIVEEVYKSNSQTEILSNYKITNDSGNKREIDLLIRSVINNFQINIAIECKEYEKNVSAEKIEAFNSKCLRIPEINKKIFIAKKGFQRDAIDAAKKFGIELYTFDDIENNANKILLPISQIKPKFQGFEVLNIFCDENPRLSDILLKENNFEFYSLEGKKFTLYDLIVEGIKDKWYQISGMAFYNWMRDESTEHKIHFYVNCTGIYFDFENEQIVVNQIECNANINFEFSEFENVKAKEYINLTNGNVKAQTLSFTANDEIKGEIVIDDKNNVHFFNTSENRISKLKLLGKYDKNTDKFESFD